MSRFFQASDCCFAGELLCARMLTVPSMASDKRLRKVPGSDFGLPAMETAFRVSVVGGGAASQVVSLAGRPTSQGRTPADAMIILHELCCARLWEESS